MKIIKISVVIVTNAIALHVQAAQVPLLLVPFHDQKATIDVVVEDTPEGYTIEREQLLRVPRLKINLLSPGPVLRLADLGKVTLDDASGELLIQVRPELLETQAIRSGRSSITIPSEPPMKAVMGDYDLRADTVNGSTRFGLLASASTWISDTRLDISVAAASGINTKITNLRAVREDLATSSLTEFGTITASSGSRSSPGQIVGFGFRRDRGIAPGFITSPQLNVNGISQTQSVVDVLIDNQRTAHTIQPGPFSVSVDPVSSGGLTSVVIRDELGQERIVSAQLWANPSLLGIGQSEYALSGGKMSNGYLKTDGYAAAGYYRAGVTNCLTLESGFELTSQGQSVTAAADVATAAGNIGFDLSLGTKKAAAAMYVLPVQKWEKWSITGSAQIAATYASAENKTSRDFGAHRQSGFSVNATNQGWSTGTTFIATERGRFLSASMGHTLKTGVSVSLSAMHFDNLNGPVSNSVFVNVAIPLDGKYLSLSANQTATGLRKSASFGGMVNDNLSASVNASGVNGFENIGADVSFGIGSASANVGIAKANGNQTAYRGSLRGGFIAHSRGITPTGAGANNGGFAVVDLGVAGVNILNGYGQKTITDSSGLAVLRLPALTASYLTIDADSAPDNLDLSPFITVVNRRGGVSITRHPVVSNGKFIQISGSKPGDILEINNQKLPITDRGVWVDLPKGNYLAIVNTSEVSILID